MKAVETNLLKFLQGTRQFVIPIYQRTYSWTLKQCEQLWEDIVRATDDDVPGHFVGSIVYVEKGLYQVAAVPQLLVIDGQQRLTTMSLLLVALGRAFEASGSDSEMTRRKLNSYYLINDQESDDKRFKLVLTRNDKETLIRLLEDREPPTKPSLRIQENFKFFEEQIAKSDLSLDQLYQGLSKLIIVDVSLDRGHDNPQLIFESMNSTGLDLTQADLIRNYVLMGLELEEQTRLYEEFWFPMEQSFGHAEYASLFDRFMRDYLTVKTGQIPKISQVYEEFKAFSQVEQARGCSVQDLVENVYRYSKHFVRIAFGRSGEADVDEAVSDINSLKVDVAYPFLLEVMEDYSLDHLSTSDVTGILRLVEAYVFRRAICGIPTNSLNKTFANLMKEIDRDNYVESLHAVFLLMDSYRRLPRDEEFQRELVVKDVYNFRSRNYLLRKLENRGGRKERVDVDTYTIEHVLPQNPNLSEEWRSELGPEWKLVQERYLHTIGNLTLTGYNPELSDKPFAEKRKMAGGFADSPIRLNQSLAQLDSWDEEAIRARADELADAASKVWQVPSLTDEVLSKYRKVSEAEVDTTYTLADHDKLQGEVLLLFEALRKRILNIDSSVREEVRKVYIAYKTESNFVDIVPQKSRLRLSLNMKYTDVDDPRGITEDVSGKGRWGNGDVQFGLSELEEIDYAMGLIQQAFDEQSELVPSE